MAKTDQIWMVTDCLEGDWWYYCSDECAENKCQSFMHECFEKKSGSRESLEHSHGFVVDTCAGCGNDLPELEEVAL